MKSRLNGLAKPAHASYRSFALSLAFLVALVTIAAVGCWGEGEDVTVDNRSDQVVVVFENDVPLALLQTRVKQGFHVPKFSGAVKYSVQSFETRQVLAERTFAWDEMQRENGITIVVE